MQMFEKPAVKLLRRKQGDHIQIPIRVLDMVSRGKQVGSAMADPPSQWGIRLPTALVVPDLLLCLLPSLAESSYKQIIGAGRCWVKYEKKCAKSSFCIFQQVTAQSDWVPVAPLPNSTEGAPVPNHPWTYNSSASEDLFYERGIPTMITWSYGGNDVAVEGSWDNWTSRKPLHRAGKDFTIMMVLPSGIYQYKFIVDGEWRYVPDLPWIPDEMGNVKNILDVQDYVPENLESVAEFEPPQSPESSYNGPFPPPEDFAKDPPPVPPHLHLTLLNVPPAEAPGVAARPQHVVLNHLYVGKEKSSQSVLALGLTHRFRSKYVTVVLYKPLKVKT